MRRFFVAAILLALCGTSAWAAPKFPALTGRVVDTAQMLSPTTEQSLNASLAAHEQATSNQVVVVTVTSLQGLAIEEYGYQLGRHWGIGQKGKNNGVLLIVAPKDRQVRIEVGYGLEGTLTDAISSQIIQTIILPQFKRGAMEAGVMDGAQAIQSVLSGSPLAAPTQVGKVIFVVMVTFFVLLFMLPFYALYRVVKRVTRNPAALLAVVEEIADQENSRGSSVGGSTGRSSSSSSSGGGFSGGGGSFGGGGSSGKW